MKLIGTILALVGGILAMAHSISAFFLARMIGHANYNQIDHNHFQNITIIGAVTFFISVGVLVIALHAFKHHYSKQLFINLIFLGALLMVMTFLFTGTMILVGGMIGLIGVLQAKKKLSETNRS
jgi:hypothetical protein